MLGISAYEMRSKLPSEPGGGGGVIVQDVFSWQMQPTSKLLLCGFAAQYWCGSSALTAVRSLGRLCATCPWKQPLLRHVQLSPGTCTCRLLYVKGVLGGTRSMARHGKIGVCLHMYSGCMKIFSDICLGS
jgi:hypothetical protein